jgi:dihydroorotase
VKLIIKNATIVNEGSSFKSDVLIEQGIIKKIASQITVLADKIIDANGLHLIPGIIDDQVHFREPGLTHKADIYTESKAAVAGGITSFMEMPNTKPQTLTQELLEEKFKIGDQKSLANFTFFMGASNTNLEEVLKTDPKNVGAIKIFMGSSTGNMMVNNRNILEKIFEKS